MPQASLPTRPVAPHAGAWIEIGYLVELIAAGGGSHLTQVRGLKYQWGKKQADENGSHLTQVRGLKFRWSYIITSTSIVAPHAGAWIEII